jgi:hypothetical protein
VLPVVNTTVVPIVPLGALSVLRIVRGVATSVREYGLLDILVRLAAVDGSGKRSPMNEEDEQREATARERRDAYPEVLAKFKAAAAEHQRKKDLIHKHTWLSYDNGGLTLYSCYCGKELF